MLPAWSTMHAGWRLLPLTGTKGGLFPFAELSFAGRTDLPLTDVDRSSHITFRPSRSSHITSCRQLHLPSSCEHHPRRRLCIQRTLSPLPLPHSTPPPNTMPMFAKVSDKFHQRKTASKGAPASPSSPQPPQSVTSSPAKQFAQGIQQQQQQQSPLPPAIQTTQRSPVLPSGNTPMDGIE